MIDAPARLRCGGLTLIEILVGLVIGTLVLAGAYRLWMINETEGYRLNKKIDLRNEMALASKRIQRAITLAGLAMGGASALEKQDAVGSDTLVVFSNQGETTTKLLSDCSHSVNYVSVQHAGGFSTSGYLALADADGGEVRKISGISGTTVMLQSAFDRDYLKNTAAAYPVTRERYYTNQDSSNLIRESNGTQYSQASSIRNFQVSFRNSAGEATESTDSIRAVQFSFAGIFPAKEGALNSILFSSTAIPRNLQ